MALPFFRLFKGSSRRSKRSPCSLIGLDSREVRPMIDPPILFRILQAATQTPSSPLPLAEFLAPFCRRPSLAPAILRTSTVMIAFSKVQPSEQSPDVSAVLFSSLSATSRTPQLSRSRRRIEIFSLRQPASLAPRLVRSEQRYRSLAGFSVGKYSFFFEATALTRAASKLQVWPKTLRPLPCLALYELIALGRVFRTRARLCSSPEEIFEQPQACLSI